MTLKFFSYTCRAVLASAFAWGVLVALGGCATTAGRSVFPPASASLWPIRTLDIQSPAWMTLQLNANSWDGRVFIGTKTDQRTGISTAIRWDAKNGVEEIVIPNAAKSEADWISNDGSLVGGIFSDTNGRAYGFQWTKKGGLQKIGEANWTRAEVDDMSSDGAIVVGTFWHDPDDSHSQAFYWTKRDGVRPLVDDRILRSIKFTPTDSGAYNITDGVPVITGWLRENHDEWAIFQINKMNGKFRMIAIGNDFSQFPDYLLSTDGSVMFGSSGVSSYNSFRWTEHDGFKELFPHRDTQISDMSVDGSKAFGIYYVGGPKIYLVNGQERLFIWTEKTGARDAGVFDPNVQYFPIDQAILKVRVHNASAGSS